MKLRIPFLKKTKNEPLADSMTETPEKADPVAELSR